MSNPSTATSGAARARLPKPKAPRIKPPKKSIRDDAFNIPNLLTFARVLMIPACLWYLDLGTSEGCYWSATIFTIAAITDALDGFLARRMGVVSVLGKFLDPLADKLIVMSCMIWLVPMGRLPAWVTALVVAREICVTGLRSVAASEGVVIAAGQEGKIKTAFQMIGLVALLVGYPQHFSFAGIDLGVCDVVRVGQILVYLSLGFSVLSAAQYAALFVMAVDAKEKVGTPKEQCVAQ